MRHVPYCGRFAPSSRPTDPASAGRMGPLAASAVADPLCCSESWVTEYEGVRGRTTPTSQCSDASTSAGRPDGCGTDSDSVCASSTKRDRALVRSSVVNLTKSIIGSGMLCLPFALQEGGAGLGEVTLFVTGGFSLGGFLAIGYACHVTGSRSYRDVWARTTGLSPSIVDAMILMECMLTCVGHTILILDYMCVVLHGFLGLGLSATLRFQLGVVLALCVLLPLCLQPHLEALRSTSLIGNTAILYTLGFVVFEYFAQGPALDSLEGAGFLGQDREGIFRATCVMTSAYIAHYSAPNFLSELREQRHSAPWRAFRTATAVSFLIALCVYTVFAAAGFVRYFPGVQGNVLLNYEGGGFSLLAWLSMALTLITTFPLHFKPPRDTLADILRLTPVSGGGLASRPSSWAVMTFISMASTVIVGMALSNISGVMALRGALLGCPISFVLPGLMLLGCPSSSGSARTMQAGCMLIVFGAVAGGLGLYCALR